MSTLTAQGIRETTDAEPTPGHQSANRPTKGGMSPAQMVSGHHDRRRKSWKSSKTTLIAISMLVWGLRSIPSKSADVTVGQALDNSLHSGMTVFAPR